MASQAHGASVSSSNHTIAIVGTTGVGKSQLAVELARSLPVPVQGSKPGGGGGGGDENESRAGGGYATAEIISADSMQVYRGLDVITNKMTRSEMNGVRHHLMDLLDPQEGKEYAVGQFITDASRLKGTFFSHIPKTLPIVVGGTSYYIQHLLFPGRLVSVSTPNESGYDGHSPSPSAPRGAAQCPAELPEDVLAAINDLPAELRSLWESLPPGSTRPPSPFSLPPNALWTLLNALDPAMAARWHYKDVRKIERSLRVLKETGRRHSELIREQEEKEMGLMEEESESDAEDAGVGVRSGGGRERTLVFWVWSERDPLRKRLDARVENMVERGLLTEILALRSIAARATEALETRPGYAPSGVANDAKGKGKANAQDVDYTRGIFQAIGYKEFAAYLDHMEQTSPSQVGVADLPDHTHPDDPVAARLFSKAIEDMQAATRRYAKRQEGWIRNKLLPEVWKKRRTKDRDGGQDVASKVVDGTADGATTTMTAKGDDGLVIYLLDATDISRWNENVRDPAVRIMHSFLDGGVLPEPQTLSKAASRELCPPTSPRSRALGLSVLETQAMRACEVCTQDENAPVLVKATEEGRREHERSKAHKAMWKRRMIERGKAPWQVRLREAKRDEDAEAGGGGKEDDAGSSVCGQSWERDRTVASAVDTETS